MAGVKTGYGRGRVKVKTGYGRGRVKVKTGYGRGRVKVKTGYGRGCDNLISQLNFIHFATYI